MIDALATSPVAHALGLALVQFVWQGALLGLAGAGALLGLRRASPLIRYLTACLTLALMFGTLTLTFVDYARAFSGAPAGESAGRLLLEAVGRTPTTSVVAIAGTGADSAATGWIEVRWPVIVACWAVGVLFCALRLLRACLMVERVRRGARPAETNWVERIAALRTALGVTRRLRVLESALVEVPSVIGWLRPLILVPASALAGLSPSQFDAVLAHELAHVRRHDYLVNLLQSVVEILLFYHPAVWFVSRQIRKEREHCCDDLAVSVCGDRVAYAAALASLEELRAGMSPLAIGARGGDLLARVRRLVAPRSAPTGRMSGWIPLAVAITTILVVGGAQGRSAALDNSAQSISDSLPASVPMIADNTATLPAISVARPVARRPAAPPVAPLAESPVPSPVAPHEQAALGSIVGIIIDPQGGRLPGATVTAKADIGGVHVDRSVFSNAPGIYQITGLDAGLYDVRVAMPGFKTFGTQIQVGSSETRLNVRLELGGVSEAITVRRSAAAGVAPAPVPPGDPRGPNDFLDLARQYYERGRLTEAAAMTSRALELMRQIAVAPVEIDLSPNAPVRVGGDIREPRKVRDVKPVYPAGAAETLRGVVILEAVIAKDGTVSDARILRSIPGLDESALDAVRQWVFTPTLLNGVPVEVIMTVTVNFLGTP